MSIKEDSNSGFQTDVLLARQPIFDRNLKLYGYELLYRANDLANSASFLCGDNATSQLLLNNFASITQATEHHRITAFINITENLIKSPEVLPIESEKVVLEILEDVIPDKALITSVLRYKKKGFKVALDDFPFTPVFEPLLEHADYIKVDVQSFSLEQISEKIKPLKNLNALLLAEKIEDHSTYVECLKLGFHLFQGYFFERPQIVRGKQIPSSKQQVLQLLSTLYDANAKTELIAEKISFDPSLSYRLLKIINSSAYNLPRKINSIKEAVVLLGIKNLKRWATLLAFASSDEAPPELLRTLLIRGRCCELLAKSNPAANSDEMFTVGLFSGIDAMLGADLNFLLEQLPLSEHITQAILQFQGYSGETLKSVIQFERAEWDSLDSTLDQALLNYTYFEAVKWCDEMCASFEN